MKFFYRTLCFALAASVLGATAARADDKATNAAATNAAPPAMKLDDLLPDVAVARGKGFEVKRSQLDSAVVSAKTTAAARGRAIPAEQLPMMEKQMLDYLMVVQILKNKADDAEKATGKQNSDKRFEQIKARAGTEENLTRQLSAVGLTPELLHKSLQDEATAQAVMHSKVTVTDEQVKKFYDDNPKEFEHPEIAHVAHILFVTSDPKSELPLTDDQKDAKKKKADEALKRVRAGEDFTKVLMECSEDMAVKDDGGELKFPRGTSYIPPEFEVAAFALQTNQVSEVVTSKMGFHIIKLMEKIPAGKASLEEASPKVKEYLQNVEIEKMLPAYSAELRKEAGAEILDPKLKALEDAAPARPAAPGPGTNAGGK
jgi:parvulin-like peptidyl-prolyl isomerase